MIETLSLHLVEANAVDNRRPAAGKASIPLIISTMFKNNNYIEER